MNDIAERPGLPANVTDITAEWLEEALSELPVLEGADVTDITEIGSGYGLAGSAARVGLRTPGSQQTDGRVLQPMATTSAAAPQASAVVLKLAPRRSGAAELAFYRDVAPRMPCRVPRCFGGWVDADPEADRAVLVLEALAVHEQGDVLIGATTDQAHAVLGAAAAFHAAFAQDAPSSLPRLTYDVDVLQRRLAERTGPFLDRHAETLPAAVRKRIDDLSAHVETGSAVLAATPATLVHTDFHLDNVLFLDRGEPAVLDWPGARRGAAAIDVARFLVEGVADALLPEHAALVAHYRDSRARAGAPVGSEFDDQLDAALDLQLVHMINWAAAPQRSDIHPRMPKLVHAYLRRTAQLTTLRAEAR